MPNYGFTGTQSPGPNAAELIQQRLTELLDKRVTWIVVGGCIGVDAIVGRFAHIMGFHVHAVLPANHAKVDPHWREYADSWEQMPLGTGYMDRNDRIVELSDYLTGFPKTEEEELRSGTWATIRRGWKKRIPVTIIPVGGN